MTPFRAFRGGLVCIVLAAAGVACGVDHTGSVVAPSAVTSAASSQPSLLGVWASQPLTGVPDPKTCGNVQWHVTTQTDTAATGDFSALCAGAVPIAGVASGQLTGTTIFITVGGAATLSGGVACDFSLSGTGVIDGDTITVPYSGTTCVGSLSGTTTLHRSQLPWPPS
jgi:hypothetical protein